MTKVSQIKFETAFNSYQAQETVGEGGSGTVFRVTDESGKTFAIKRLDPHKATTEKRKRFRNELFFCLGKPSPNIIEVREFGHTTFKDEKTVFYVMPYYPATLRQLMQEGIPREKVLHYFSQILNGVEAAHLLSTWHRDLKPENILHDPPSDILVVGDFGIAHFTEEQLHTLVKTGVGDRLANFPYAAPEQGVKGQPVDHRADIYALGLILNEMFTGKIPKGTSYKTIASVAPDYAYLDDLVDLMIRQSPEERPSTIDDVKRRLIVKQNEFVSRQKLNQLRNTVIPRSEIDDPLVNDPVRYVRPDYQKGNLILYLSQPVNQEWINRFKNIHYRYAIQGKEPMHFNFKDDRATISVSEHQAQHLVDYFKEYLDKANTEYAKRVVARLRGEEIRQKQQLEAEIREEEKRQRILKKLTM